MGRKLLTIIGVLAGSFILTAGACFAETVQLSIDGKQVEATVEGDEEGSFTVTYTDEDGEHSFNGGGMAEDENGVMRPITMEEYIEHLQSDGIENAEENVSLGDVIESINESGFDIQNLFDLIADLVDISVNNGESTPAGNIIRAVGNLVKVIINGEDTSKANNELIRELIIDNDDLSQLSSGTLLDVYEICREELVSRGIVPDRQDEPGYQVSDAELNIDYSTLFPSWNPDSASLKELVDFVSHSTDESGPDYLDPEDRIAVFDMDGTILCEKAPVCFDWCMTMHRVLDDPTFDATEEERSAMEKVREIAYNEGKTFYGEDITKDDLISTAFAGMTPEEFRSYVVDFADSEDALGFEGMTYGESFYKPMIEVLNYLKANDFDVWVVSACEREVVRALLERFDFPYDHIIATDVPYVASGKGDEPADEYNMESNEEILLGTPIDPLECRKSEKPAAIAREIGKRPVLAFGNGAGDYSMLAYTEANPDHEGKGFFIVCDDTQREYGSDEKAAGYFEKVEEQGWTAVSMADDWATIYGDGVQKTELPGTDTLPAEAKEKAS